MSSDIVPNELDRMNFSISTAQLKEIGASGDAFADALALAKEIYGEESVQLASDAIGDGFALTDNKDQFIGKPCIFLKWTFSQGDFIDPKTKEKREFASIRVVTPGGKYVINDGSTGICDQLRQFTMENFGRQGGLISARGLRRSDYEHPEYGSATTYYIDTSAAELTV
jgi:hypothetical protein